MNDSISILGLFFSFYQSKIVRVLNLWQNNGVFDINIIQPLMDLANGTTVLEPPLEGN